MNKLKTVFQRTQKSNTEERRPQQFVKRHSSISTADNISPGTVQSSNGVNKTMAPPPAINLADLSEMEKPAYLSWWKDLDPFDLQKINNETILKFLNGCSLPDNKLEQIVALFETAGDGLNKLQFFAMLRLIAHAQNGRKISPALVYLGAPIPHFHTNAIDVLIKSDASQEPELTEKSTTTNQRKSWWGNEKQQQMDNRRSYMGPFTTHTPIPNSPFHHHQSNNAIMEYYYALPPISNCNSNPPVWPTVATTSNDMTTIRPSLTSSMTTATTTITSVTPNVIQLEEKQHYSHSRSRSAGTAIDFNPYQQQQEDLDEEPGPLQSSRSSLSLHELNTGQSLLLTQKFVYQSPSIRNQEINSSSNPFNIPSTPPTITTNTTTTNIIKETPIMSPFDDENHSDDNMMTPTPTNFQIYNRRNDKPNKHSIPPPPVPNQSTKPAFPKYTRTNTFLIKRSQSIAEDRKQHFNKHQRHKSTSATENIFY